MRKKRGRVPEDVEAGPGTYFGGKPTILWPKYGSKLIVGNYTSIAANVTFFLGGHHHMDGVSMRLQRRGKSSYSKGDIRIGSDVWICHGAVILDGVTIGDGAVVGAFSVVASDVEPYAVVVGNPAKVVKYRFDEPICKALLKIRWWDWSKEKIVEEIALICSGDTKEFIRRHG